MFVLKKWFMNTKRNYGWPIILGLSIFPVFIWIAETSLLARFSDFNTSMTSIGQVLGLVGVSMFAVNLILSARLSFFEKYFHGLNDLYIRHSQLGQLALMMLMFHPIFLLAQYSAGTFAGAVAFLLPGRNWAMNFGISALGSMILLIILTLYLRPKYNLWKFTHKFLGFAFFLGALHVWLIQSDISRDMFLRIYILGLSFFGIISFFYRSLLDKFTVPRYRYVIKEVRPLSNDVVQIFMTPVSKVLNFNAGQFGFIQFLDKAVGREVHPYSFSSNPEDSLLSITVKKLGDYTQNISELSEGSIVEIEGPFGIFSHLEAGSKKQIWIGGGIGITPFVSMARSLKIGDGFKIDLYYCVRDEAEAVMMTELEEISKNLNGSLKILEFCSVKKGRISVDSIIENSGELENKDIFICAPPAMINSLKEQFTAKGIKPSHVHSEEFSF